jgi:RNA polymerase sigma-B factor
VNGGRDRGEELARFRAYRESGDRALRDALLAEHHGLAVSLAQRLARRGEPLEDLVQVADLGLLRAIERYDPEREVSFAAFAVPTVLGELKRHFRDHTWSVRVPRPTKELYVRLRAAVAELTLALERAPSVHEVAVHLGVDDERVLEAMEAGAGYRSASMSTPAVLASADAAGRRRGDGDEDGDDRSLTRVALHRALAELAPRERRIVYLRFFEDRTQAEIGAELGISQMHVSRLLRASLARLSESLGHDLEHVLQRPTA